MVEALERGAREDELDLYLARLGDPEIARLLALVVLPALSRGGTARRLVTAAVARLVRADRGGLAPRAASALTQAVDAVCARQGAPSPPRIKIYPAARSR